MSSCQQGHEHPNIESQGALCFRRCRSSLNMAVKTWCICCSDSSIVLCWKLLMLYEIVQYVTSRESMHAAYSSRPCVKQPVHALPCQLKRLWIPKRTNSGFPGKQQVGAKQRSTMAEQIKTAWSWRSHDEGCVPAIVV